jgi:hypothetical protein
MPENTVTFNNILVNSLNTNAGIFVGTNSQSNWSSGSNNKSGFGSVLGTRNVISRSVNIFMDNDIIDTPIITNNYNGSKPPIDGKCKGSVTLYGRRQGKSESL